MLRSYAFIFYFIFTQNLHNNNVEYAADDRVVLVGKLLLKFIFACNALNH